MRFRSKSVAITCNLSKHNTQGRYTACAFKVQSETSADVPTSVFRAECPDIMLIIAVCLWRRGGRTR